MKTRTFAMVATGALSSGLLAANMPWYMGSSNPADNAPAAIETYPIAPGPAPVTVAVIDSGVIAEHPSLKGVLLPGYDMVSGANNIRGGRSANFAPDERSAQCGQKLVSGTFRTHGTEVSSVIAGNGVDGMQGVNPKAKILPIRVFSVCGMSASDLADAMLWAGGIAVPGVPDNPNPARVINISISGGGSNCSTQLQSAVDQLVAKDIFIVVAAGNNFNKPLAQPANCRGVISVGAVSADNRIETYSALDPRTSIYSPGGGKPLEMGASWSINKIRVATYTLSMVGNEQASVADKGVGTSFAAPVVAGYISLWLSHNPNVTLAQWQTELPQFVRGVTPLEAKCPDCKPQGLVANVKKFVP